MERVEEVDDPIRIVVLEDAVADIDVGAQLGGDSQRFHLRSESTIEAATEVLSDWPADCVICVHDPPAIDGIEILSQLRETHPDLPILVATEARDADRAVSREATDILQLTDGRVETAVVQNRIEQLADRTRALGKYEQIFQRANDGVTIHERETGDIVEAEPPPV